MTFQVVRFHLSEKPVIRPHDKVRDSSELLDERIGLISLTEILSVQMHLT
jgi:hypothetical protein